jgi:essential nuclear protein 1
MPRPAQTGRRHNALEDDLLATGPLKNKTSKRKSRHEDDGDEKFVDAKASRKILKIGQELAAEDEEERESGTTTATAFDFEARFDEEDQSDDGGYDDAEAWGDEDEIVEEIELAPEDLETYSKFFPTQEDPLLRHGWDGGADEDEGGETTNLADLILEKIAAHEAAQGGRGDAQFMNGAIPDDDFELPPKVVEVYTK